MSRLSRRTVIKAAAASAVLPWFTISGTKASGRSIGANDTIRVAVAGINGRGGAHIDELAKVNKTNNKVHITHLIDPDSSLFASRTKTVADRFGKEPTCVQDVRRLLDDKSIDAITVATTNHWHSLITIWACQAGKDVYVEKPISHNIFEGRQCVEAAKIHNRVVQHGTQSRSSEGKAREVAIARSGKYGKLLVSKGYCCKPRWSIGFKDVERPPASLDWNVWLGPAPMQDFHRNLVHYNWHWFWDTGNGDIGNQGVHEMDIARWAIPEATLPTKVYSLGGRFLPDGPDQGQTPNMQLAVMEFGDVLLLFEVRGLVGKKEHPDYPSQVTNEYYTTDGVIRGGKFYKDGKGEGEPISGGDDARVAPGGAFGAFVNAMRSRKPEDNNCDAEVAHYSAACCHLPNISYRLGRGFPLGAVAAASAQQAQVKEAFEKIRDNTKAVGVKLGESDYTLGATLTFDPVREKFTGENAEAANKLLTRPYREPFVVPDLRLA